ncbi:uncharacterized protein LOC120328217 [Styela clava]|uniref:G protein pathway suppressor 2-like n=1 Tax=Styela clava TaxID=7725 RepID=UPI001939A1A9|nr:G protein pathway suppressor 2-like [Styela clava]
MPSLVEREEMSEPMKEALRRHVVREREKRMREEKEAEKDFERRAKIEEERRRKEEEDSVTLEQIKDQLSSLHKKHETLKDEKHQLFCQLKKVLQEEERKKQKIKEQTEMVASSHGHYSHSLSNMSNYQMMQGGHYQHHQAMPYLSLPGRQSSPRIHPSLRHSMNPQTSPAPHQGVKRPHSPASPQPSPIQMYQRASMAASGHLPTAPQHSKYDHAFSAHPSSHFSLSGLTNPPTTQHGSIHGTPSRHISVLHGTPPTARSNDQRSPYNSLSLDKQLEMASQKSGFGDDSGSLSSPGRRSMIRMLPQGPLIPQQVTQGSRSRSGSPGRYQGHPEKPHSPFHVANPLSGSRYY